MDKYLAGFNSQTTELSDKRLVVTGEIPDWLTGSLYRNGPALFEAGNRHVKHWFDGFGMLHRYAFKNGTVSYSNRFIESRGYLAAVNEKRIKYHLFATQPDYNWLQKIIAWFREPEFSYNTNVNIAKYGSQFVSLTESAELNTHDPVTLKTSETIDLTHIGEVTTAHPHFDYDRNEFINFCIQFGPKSKYRFFRKDVGNGEPKVFAEYTTPLPSYAHSFGLTQNYVILHLSPLKVNPIKFRFGNKPYYDCYRWYDEHDTKLVVLSRHDGRLIKEISIEKSFVFHFVNCYEQENQVVIDYCAADNSERINHFYLEIMKEDGPGPMALRARLKRCVLTINGDGCEISDSGIHFEMPMINYKYYNTYEYQYAYGLSNHADTQELENALIKVNMSDMSVMEWYQPGMYPQEGLFVAHPESMAEDDGVILSVVLDTEKQDSFLLILDANDLSELARAYIGQVVPFGFHGIFE